jgi:predicted nucleotidyltransferase
LLALFCGNAIHQFLKSNKKVLENEFGIIKIALFGSFARGEQSDASDVDLVIETNDFSFEKRCQLKDFLQKNLSRPVDLCYFRGMRRVVRSMIEKNLVYA